MEEAQDIRSCVGNYVAITPACQFPPFPFDTSASFTAGRGPGEMVLSAHHAQQSYIGCIINTIYGKSVQQT
jgi:hypothetical protein